MTDQAQAARDDLAFMKAVAEDRGPLPSLLGAHLLAAGAPFGLNVIYAWAGIRGFVPWPAEWQVWSWAPAAVVYTPWLFVLLFAGRRATFGPSGRGFAGPWAGVGLMTVMTVSVLAVATPATGPQVWLVWPALAVTIYGGAWASAAFASGRYWGLVVAAGCFATAIACSALINTPEHWLAMGLGLLLFVAVPGWLMMRRARRASS
jgi:hypothetical protein